MSTDAERVSHTRGPWEWQWAVDVNGHSDGRIFTGWNTAIGIAAPLCVAVSPRFQNQKQWEADARLIAAAPTMLAALHAALNWYTPPNDIGPFPAQQVAEAIAKAEGRDE